MSRVNDLPTVGVDVSAPTSFATADEVIALTNSGGIVVKGAMSLLPFAQSGTGAVTRTVQGKAREIVSSFDFMTAAQIADVQARTYLVDVSSPVQKALNYADSISGAWVFNPYGGYLLGTRLQIEDNTKFTGCGPGATIFKLASTIANTAAQCLKTETGVGTHTNIVIEDLEIDGNKSNITPSGITEGEGSLIYLDQVDGATIRNVYVHDAVDNGMYIVNSPNNIVVEGCTVTSNGKAGASGGRGIVFGVSPTKFRITNNNCSDNRYQGILVQSEGGAHAENFTISNNVVKANGASGIDLTDNTISGAVAIDIYIRRGAVTGNICQGNTLHGIRISENTTANGGGFVGIAEDIAVTGNVCQGNTQNGILVSVSAGGLVKRANLTGNTCTDNGGSGIDVTGAGVTDTRISGYTLLGNQAAITNTGTRTIIDPVVLALSSVAITAPIDTNQNTMATVVIPATMVCLNGTVVITSQWSCTNNANAKTIRTKFGGSSYQDFDLSNTTAGQTAVSVSNRNNVAAQVGATRSVTDAGTIAQVSVGLTTTVNTAAAVTLLLTAQKGTGTDAIVLESYKVEVFPG